MAAAPLVTPLTCQVTAVLVPPVTVAVNCAVPPMRVCAAPATVTVAGVAGAVLVGDVLLPPHPLKKKKAVAQVTVTGPRGRRKCSMLRACNDKAGMGASGNLGAFRLVSVLLGKQRPDDSNLVNSVASF